MRHIDWILSSILIVILLGHPSSGLTQEIAQPEEEWKHVAVFQNNGTFEYCAVENTYTNQRSLLFVLTPTGEFLLLIGMADGNLQIGQEISMTIKIDRQIVRAVKGIATSSALINIPLGRDDAFYQGIMDGVTLFITDSQETLSFALRRTRQALTRLKECTDTQGVNFQAVRQPAPDETAQQNTQQQAVPPFILRTIRSVGLNIFPIPQSGGGIVIAFGQIVGSIDFISAPADQTMDSLINAYVNPIKENECQNDFELTLEPAQPVNDSVVQVGKATCIFNNDFAQYINWIFQRTPEEQIFVYSIRGSIVERLYVDAMRLLVRLAILNQLQTEEQ